MTIRDRYRLERRLGGGGMASVHLAHDAELDRPVAVKLLADHLAGDAELRARFVREARIAARLAHPNVVAVYDAGEEDGTPYIVMEHVDGETLADLLRREGRLEAERAVGLALQACAGLAHAHEAGLVHRDVKPGNLLLRRDGTLKIADFGIARATETTRLTLAGTILGTAAYLAPEQAAGEEVTPAADVYSLGAVLYECLAGRPPRRIESLADLDHAEPVMPLRDVAPEVDERLEDAVMRALARRPEFRPATAGELARELDGAPPTLPLRRAHRQRRRVWPALVAVFVLAALVGAFAFADGDETEPSPRARAPVQPVPQGASPDEDARNLAEWLRRYSARTTGAAAGAAFSPKVMPSRASAS